MINKCAILLPYIEAVILIVSAIFVYKQVKIAARAGQLEAMMYIDKKFEVIDNIRDHIFLTFPAEIVMNINQFAKKPPGRYKIVKYGDNEIRKMKLTEAQENAVSILTNAQIAEAKKVICLLNDVGQLIEDGFIGYNMVLGKYHTNIIRLCFILEPIRRKIESENRDSIGGNYGQRLLRLLDKALLYKSIHSKHRYVPIKIIMGTGKEPIEIIKGRDSSILESIGFLFKRFRYIMK